MLFLIPNFFRLNTITVIDRSMNTSVLKKVFWRYPSNFQGSEVVVPFDMVFCLLWIPKIFFLKKKDFKDFMSSPSIKLLVHLQGSHDKGQTRLSPLTVWLHFGIGLQHALLAWGTVTQLHSPNIYIAGISFQWSVEQYKPGKQIPFWEGKSRSSEMKKQVPVCQPFSLQTIT